MTDDPRPPHDPSDARDEQLAARLRTEPLDDVTRARLVRTAMAATEPATATPRRDASRWSARARGLAVAAALVVLLVIGLAVVLRDDSGSGPTAANAPKASDAAGDRRSGANDELELGTEFSGGARVQSLGALGDVGSPAKLRHAIASTSAPTPAAPAAAAEPVPTTAPALRATVTACDTGAIDRLGEVVAVGTGTADGQPVTVYVVEKRKGSRVAIVVGVDCVAGKPVAL